MTPAESSWPQYPDSPPPPPAAPAAPAPLAVRDPIHQKSPRLAVVLSAFPGLGNVYNGLYLRGFIEFLIVAGLFGLVDRHDTPFLVMSLLFFWAFSILDAYRQAVLINYGYAQDLGLLDRPQRPSAGQGGLIAGLVLTVIGVLAFIEEFIDVDLRWLYDLWPVLLIGIGIWLIVASIKERRKASAPDGL
jgi:cell wall-active antibiotic response 4TMS protein YvqF